MFSFLCLIFLSSRYTRFSRLARAADVQELRAAMRYSGYAMAVCFVSGVLSFVPLFIEALRQNAQGISIGISVGGIICAIALDLKAERLKREAAIPKGTESALIERGKELQKSPRAVRRNKPITLVLFFFGILLVLFSWLSPFRESTVALIVGLAFIALSIVFYLLLGSTKQVTGPSREEFDDLHAESLGTLAVQIAASVRPPSTEQFIKMQLDILAPQCRKRWGLDRSQTLTLMNQAADRMTS